MFMRNHLFGILCLRSNTKQLGSHCHPSRKKEKCKDEWNFGVMWSGPYIVRKEVRKANTASK